MHIATALICRQVWPSTNRAHGESPLVDGQCDLPQHFAYLDHDQNDRAGTRQDEQLDVPHGTVLLGVEVGGL